METQKSIEDRLSDLIKGAAEKGDFEEVARLAHIGKDLKALNDEERRLAERKSRILNEFSGAQSVAGISDPRIDSSPTQEVTGYPPQMSRKACGDKARADWVLSLQRIGIRLDRLRGKRYQTQSGMQVGVAYASELDVRPGAWFLGLADERVDIVSLLCEAQSAHDAKVFVLPPEFVRKIWDRLTRSNGQLKFHVLKSGPNYELRLPGGSSASVTQYLDAVEVLR